MMSYNYYDVEFVDNSPLKIKRGVINNFNIFNRKILFLNGPKKRGAYKIFDVLGNLLVKNDCETRSSVNFNLSDFPKGIYYIQIQNISDLEVKKIILQ